MARIFSPGPSLPRPRAPKRVLSHAHVADDAHQARADAEVAAAVAAVDRWCMSDAGPLDLDLSDSCMAAVDAAEARAVELGASVTRPAGDRVVLRLRVSSVGHPVLGIPSPPGDEG